MSNQVYFVPNMKCSSIKGERYESIMRDVRRRVIIDGQEYTVINNRGLEFLMLLNGCVVPVKFKMNYMLKWEVGLTPDIRYRKLDYCARCNPFTAYRCSMATPLTLSVGIQQDRTGKYRIREREEFRSSDQFFFASEELWSSVEKLHVPNFVNDPDIQALLPFAINKDRARKLLAEKYVKYCKKVNVFLTEVDTDKIVDEALGSRAESFTARIDTRKPAVKVFDLTDWRIADDGAVTGVLHSEDTTVNMRLMYPYPEHQVSLQALFGPSNF